MCTPGSRVPWEVRWQAALVTPVTRHAVRVVLLDASSRVLLFEGRDLSDAADSERFWFTARGRCPQWADASRGRPA